MTVDAPLTYNLPEYFQRRNGGSMDTASIASKAVPSTLVADISRDIPSFPQQWMNDRTRTLAAVWLLQHKQPDLLLVHLVDLDSDQHDLGPFNNTSRATLERTDELIGQMLNAVLAIGYDVVVTSDHGFERVNHMADLKILLADRGIAGDVRSLGGVATTNDPAAAAFLGFESETGKDGIGRIIPASELQQYAPGLAGSLLVVEPAEHYMFGSGSPGHDRPSTPDTTSAPQGFLTAPAEKGNHGFWPTRGDYGSVYVLFGANVSPKHLGRIEMISIKDRLAEVIGLNCR